MYFTDIFCDHERICASVKRGALTASHVIHQSSESRGESRILTLRALTEPLIANGTAARKTAAPLFRHTYNQVACHSQKQQRYLLATLLEK
jgi:hypothetical protein